jgi:hypothetical protein
VAQGVGPEFKPQYWEKKKKEEEEEIRTQTRKTGEDILAQAKRRGLRRSQSY